MKNNIKKVLINRKIKQSVIAEKAGIRREYLNRLINGHIVPSVYLAIRIARALDFPVEDLFVL